MLSLTLAKQALQHRDGKTMPIQDSNNFIVTGIPRSGTSLLCNLLNRVKNIVCFNEIGPFYNVDTLPSLFHHIRSAIKTGSPLPVPISKESGEEITDTQDQLYTHELTKIDVDRDEKFATGSKINVPYLLQIDKILSFRFKVIMVVRNPAHTIASWNKHQNINEQYVMDTDFEKWPRYRSFNFKSEDKLGRQVELYNKLMGIIEDKAVDDSCLMYEYERIVEEPIRVLKEICTFLGMDNPVFKELPELKNLNRDSRFPEIDIDAIRESWRKINKL